MKNIESKWQCFHIRLDAEWIDLLSLVLFDLGCTGVEEATGVIRAYFPEKALSLSDIEFRDLLAEKLQIESHHVRISKEWVVDRDWNAEWKQNYHCIRITQKILVRPSWEPLPKEVPACVIDLDPEMAFGTGTHATTQLVMQFIEERITPGDRILDVGTGTGILSIAALKLGASYAIGFDIEEVAALTAVNNARKNSVQDRFFSFCGHLNALRPRPFDMIFANVNRQVLLTLLPLFKERLANNGTLLLSGILASEREILKNSIESLHFFIREIRPLDEWLAFDLSLTDT
ncbi:50S ribosomal protein L11 methyltransferase [candidate division KSB1 bacterium]|nr:50S ribosomal protein L11 methyltransferase [candidate division KSB1 bacterium]